MGMNIFGYLSRNERINASIEALVRLGKKLERHPYMWEYLEERGCGFSIYPLRMHLNMTYKEICNKYLPEYVIPDGYKKCYICGEIKPDGDFFEIKDRPNSKYSRCKLCDYFKRNGLVVPAGWTENEIIRIVDYIINRNMSCINELCDIFKHRTLSDFTDLLSNKLNIGNKTLNVKVNCAYCGKVELKVLSVYLKNKNDFCSYDCYWKHKKDNTPVGEDNPDYNRITTHCTNCGIELKVVPFDYNRRNANGDNHNFCTQECYWEYRKKYYVGENNSQYGVKKTNEQRRKQRIITASFYKKGIFDRTTKPQKAINKLLDKMNIAYENEQTYKYYSVDNYIEDYNLIIEVMGDYFHANPLVFQKINDMQYNDIIRDKRKRTYIKRYHKINILYLWEDDIKNRIGLVEKLIEKYVMNNGMLEKYDSFNYVMDNNGKLFIRNKIIKPYMDYTAKQLSVIRK